MSSIKALGTLLTANADDRTLTYRLLPYGEQGRTSAGRVTASAGTLTLPAEPGDLVLNLEHDRKRPVGKGVSLAEDDGGLTASFKIAATSAGDDLLAEAAEGLRTGISVEVDGPVIRSGRLLGGVLSGAGACTVPAFPSARMVAADAGDLTPEQLSEFADAGVYVPPDSESTYTDDEVIEVDGVKYRKITESTHTTHTTIEPVEGDTDDGPADEADPTDTDTTEVPEDQEEDMTASKAASAPADLRASAAKGSGRLTASSEPRDLFRMLATAGATQDNRLIAELVDITQTGAIGNTEVPQYVGKLWDGRAYERRIIPLFNHADLTSYKVNGWRWKIADAGDVSAGSGQGGIGANVTLGEVLKPRVKAYDGDKAAVPSNMVKTAPVTIEAERIAGAHDIDRKYKDFGDEGFWQSYVAAMTESYAELSDLLVMTEVLSEATDVTVGEHVEGVSEVWAKIVDGVLAVLLATNAVPNAATVAPGLYRQFLLTPQDKGLEYLNAALGWEQGTVNSGNFAVVPHTALDPGDVMVSAREAVTVHELSTVPIRVEAENIGQAGIDVGVFGYYAVNVHDSTGLALVSGSWAPVEASSS